MKSLRKCAGSGTISRRCGHDVHRVVAYYREFQEQLKQSSDYRFAAKVASSDAGGKSPATVVSRPVSCSLPEA